MMTNKSETIEQVKEMVNNNLSRAACTIAKAVMEAVDALGGEGCVLPRGYEMIRGCSQDPTLIHNDTMHQYPSIGESIPDDAAQYIMRDVASGWVDEVMKMLEESYKHQEERK